MKSFIGGLFKDRKSAELARQALLENGIEGSAINMLECTHEKEAVVVKEQPTIQAIGRGALVGAIALGALGALIGALVGLGVIHLPSLEPSGGQTLPFELTTQFLMASIATGLVFGIWTGGIVGAAIRMALMGYETVNTAQTVNKGDLMLAVEANDIRKETKAKLTMKEFGARKFEEFRDTWDTEIWSVPREEIPQT